MAAAEMNQTYIARGAQQAIVVKFADTPKEKEKRKLERQVSLMCFNLQHSIRNFS